MFKTKYDTAPLALVNNEAPLESGTLPIPPELRTKALVALVRLMQRIPPVIEVWFWLFRMNVPVCPTRSDCCDDPWPTIASVVWSVALELDVDGRRAM